MKIAVYHNLPSGGARRAMTEMVRVLVDRGHNVHEYCPATADRSFFSLDGVVARTVVLPFRPAGVMQRRMIGATPYLTAMRLYRDMLDLERINRRLAQQIDGECYDVVFTHDCQLVQNPDILRFLRSPSVHYCHHGGGSSLPVLEDTSLERNLWQRLCNRYYAFPKGIYPRLRERRARANIRAADMVLTNSYFSRESLYHLYGVNSDVCYLGVNSTRFFPLGAHRQPFVLSVGAVHYNKGYRFLLNALGHIPSGQRPPLVIAANSWDVNERRVLEEHALRNGIELTIQQINNDEALRVLYNTATAFVYTPIMEPWGLTTMEAMACGAPVVAVREGGVREAVVDGETGILTDRHAAEFAAALQSVLADPSLAKRLGQSGVQRARLFTWERTTIHLESLLVRMRGVHGT